MSEERRRQNTIIAMAVMAVVLVIGVIYVGNAITQNQAPTNSSAASALTECILAKRTDILPFYAKNGWNTDASMHDAIVANWKQIAKAGEYDSVAAQCAVSASAPPSGTNTPTPTPTPTPATNAAAGTKVCGETCTTTADCKAPAGDGTAICRSGKCENALCPAGLTQAGSICSCNKQNSCGEQCSSGRGLCDGTSVCTFIVSSSSQCTNPNTGTYCVPITTYNTLSRCTGSNTTDKFYTGGLSGLANLCNPPSSGANPYCGDSVCNGTETINTCSRDCNLPNTAVISDEVDRIIVGAILIVFGVVAVIYHKRHFQSKL